ncbi:hypothetical protein F511_36447 [Dorcoceras hygrometricum]|uniref:Uncharacterized protein n=1 Tax=Dorcoceras hygrometricum TaxID=472368 RepID=A0A2Z7AP22_9LAMI|nr:hypothetical protein F511_36447 [Dorcoceras hygrometricum]
MRNFKGVEMRRRFENFARSADVAAEFSEEEKRVAADCLLLVSLIDLYESADISYLFSFKPSTSYCSPSSSIAISCRFQPSFLIFLVALDSLRLALSIDASLEIWSVELRIPKALLIAFAQLLIADVITDVIVANPSTDSAGLVHLLLSAPTELSSSADCDEIIADVIIADSRSCASSQLLIVMMSSLLLIASSRIYADVITVDSRFLFALIQQLISSTSEHCSLLMNCSSSILLQ